MGSAQSFNTVSAFLSSCFRISHTAPGGAFVKKIRLRYQCRCKVRHPQLCDGQSGYGVTTLDGIVEKAIRRLFDRVKTIPEDEMIQSQMRKQEPTAKRSSRARKSFATAGKKNCPITSPRF